MDHDEERSLSLGTELSASVPPPSPLTGCYLLAVIGEPHTNEHKEIILQRLVKGLLSWDSNEHQVDLEKELSTLTAQAPEGEEARYGERLIQFASENLVTEILIHPQMNTLMQCMRNLLSSFTRHRHLVHAGYTFAGNGSWIMQDGTFSLSDFTDAYQENEVQRVIRAYENSISIDIHCSTSGGGEWHKLPDMPFVKHCKIRVNPTDILDSGSQAIKDFVGYLEPYIVPASLEQLLVSSDVVGNIRFSHPTLYVFPGGQGDAALFGINGFNMLVDGGFSRKACWWDFARHLDRLDAVLFTRLNNCSVSGMAAVLHRKATTPVYPQIGHFFCNLEERRALASPDGDKDSDPLLVSLLQQGSDMMADLRHLNLKPQYCYRSPDPINLYHKVGHGTLDMYVLNPSKDSKYVREFLKRWHNSEQKLFEGSSVSGQFNFPIPNLVSICALLVWRPANPDDTVTRIMFPGSTPQHKIFEGLEKLKHLEFLQTPTCTGRQMTASATPPPASVISTKATKTTSRSSKEKSTVTQERTKEEKITESESQAKKELKDIIKDGTDTKNILDNKLLSELVDGEDKKIESILHEAITARVESTLDDKIAQFESTVIDGLPKKKEIKKKIVEKRTKKAEKIDDTTDSIAKITDTKKETEVKLSEPKARTDIRKRAETRAKTDNMSLSANRTKISNRSTQKVFKDERKALGNTIDKKAISEDKRSPPTTPKKTLESKSTSSIQSAVKERVKAKTRKLSPGSTPGKSTKEAANRRVVESKYKQPSPKRDISQKPTEKKEPKPKREPISRRPRPLASPIKGLKPMKSPSKTIKSVKTDAKLKGIQRVNYEDILKEAKKSDEDTSKSLDDMKQQELDEKEEQEIVREIEAVFNRDSEAEERNEYVGRSDIEKITRLLDNAKTEATVDTEFEEEYLIIEKEEVDQYTEDSINDHVSSQDREDELQKHVKDKAESEKKKEVGIEQNTEITKEAKEHSLSVEEKQDISSEKKTSDSKSKETKPKDSLELNIVQESQPDEKISTTVESGATTAPTLPEDERITLDDIKEDKQVEEKHVREDTKENIPPQTLIDTSKPASIEKSPKLETQPPAPIREIVKTPDEVADLPLHEEVDYRTYEEKKTPIEEDVFKRKPDVGFVHEIKVPKDLPIHDQNAVSYKGLKTIQDDVIIKTIERPSHAELVTVTPGSAPESPMYQEPKKITSVSNKDMDHVKEFDSTDFNYTQYTEKLRETHITTLDSPLKEDIIVIDEVPCMPEKIPSIPEDVEKEIEEARKLETIDRPSLSPKDVERIVADVAEVLKSEKSLDELIAKSPTLLKKSPESFTNLEYSPVSSAIASSEMQLVANEKKETDHKLGTKTTEAPMKEVSPVRSITSEDVSESSDKTVLSEGKKTKREIKDNKVINVNNTLKETDNLDVIVDDKIANYDIVDEKNDALHTTEKGERKLSVTLDTAKTLEKLEEKMADLKRKEEAFSQRLLHDRKLSSTSDKKDSSPEKDEQTHEKLGVKKETDLIHEKNTKQTDETVDETQTSPTMVEEKMKISVEEAIPQKLSYFEFSIDERTRKDANSTELTIEKTKFPDSAIENKSLENVSPIEMELDKEISEKMPSTINQVVPLLPALTKSTDETQTSDFNDEAVRVAEILNERKEPPSVTKSETENTDNENANSDKGETLMPLEDISKDDLKSEKIKTSSEQNMESKKDILVKEDIKSADSLQLQKELITGEGPSDETPYTQSVPIDIRNESLSLEKPDLKILSREELKVIHSPEMLKEKFVKDLKDDASKNQLKHEQVDSEIESHSKADTKASVRLTLDLESQDEDLEEYMSSPPLTADTVKADELSIEASPFEKLSPSLPSSVVNFIKSDELKISPVKKYSETTIDVRLVNDSPRKEEDRVKSSPEAGDTLPRPKQVDEKTSSSIKQSDDKSLTAEILDDKTKSPVKSKTEQNLTDVDIKTSASLSLDQMITIKSNQETSNFVKVQDKLPSPVKSEQMKQSPDKSKEKSVQSKVISPSKQDITTAIVPSKIQKDDKQQITVEVESDVLGSIEVSDKAPSPAKLDNRKPSKEETETLFDDKLPSFDKAADNLSSLAHSEEEEQSPVEKKDEVLNFITTDVHDYNKTKLDKEELSTNRNVFESNDEISSHVKIEQDQKSPINVKKCDFITEVDAQATTRSKVDEMKLSLTETVISSNDKSLSPVQSKSDQYSPEKIKDRDLTTAQIDVKTSCPIKVGDKKHTTEIDITDDKSLNNDKKEFNDTCTTQVKDEHFEVDTKTSSPTKADKTKSSVADYIILSDDKSQSLVQKESGDASPTKVKGNDFSSAQADARTTSTTEIEQSKPNVACESDEPFPIRIQNQLDGKTHIPTKENERKQSLRDSVTLFDKIQVQRESSKQSPLTSNDNELSSIQNSVKSLSPKKQDEIKHSKKEVMSYDKSQSPVSEELNESYHREVKDENLSPVQVGAETPYPSKVEERKPSTAEIVNTTQHKLSSPVQSELDAQCLIKVQEEDLNLVQLDAKTPSPKKKDERKPSIKESFNLSDEKSVIVTTTKDKSPGLVQSELDKLSLIKAKDENLSSVQEEAKMASPSKVDKKKPSLSEIVTTTDGKSISPVQSDLDEPTSTIKLQDKDHSLVQGDAKIPSPTKIDESNQSMKKSEIISDEKTDIATTTDDNMLSPVQSELDYSCPIKLQDEKLSLVQVDAKTSSPIKVDERKPSIKASVILSDEKTEVVTTTTDKSPGPVQSELDKMCPIKAKDENLSSSQGDTKTPSPSKEEEKKPSLSEIVTTTDDKSLSPVQSILDEPTSPIKLQDKDSSLVQGDAKTPSPTKIDKSNQSIKESVIISDEKTEIDTTTKDKSPGLVQSELDKLSPIKAEDENLSSVQEDAKTPSPSKEEEKKPSISEIVTTTENKSLSPVQSELDEPTSPIKLQDKDRSLVQGNAKIPNPTKIDESNQSIKDSVILSDKKTEIDTTSKDKSPGLVQKESDKLSPIKAKDENLSSVQGDAKTPSPSKVDEKKPSLSEIVTTTDVKSLSPVQSELDEPTSPIKLQDKDRSLVQGEAKIPSPTKIDESNQNMKENEILSDKKSEIATTTDDKALSPVQSQIDYSSSLLKLQDEKLSFVQVDAKTSRTIKVDERKPSIKENGILSDEKSAIVTTTTDKSPGPVQSQLDKMCPIKAKEENQSSLQGDTKTPNPLKEEQKKPSPSEIVITTDDKSLSPVQSVLNEPTSPIKLQDKDSSLVQGDAKTASPTKIDESYQIMKESVIISDEKTDIDTTTKDKSPGLVQSELDKLSPIKADDEILSSVHGDAKTRSPSKEEEKKPSLSEIVTTTEYKSLSPVQSELDEPTSAIKLQDKDRSLVQGNAKIPSPTKIDESNQSMKESVIISDEKTYNNTTTKDKSPGLVQSELDKLSPINADDEILSSVQVDAKSHSPSEEEETKPILSEIVTTTEYKSLSPVQSELDEPTSIKLQDKDRSLVQGDAKIPTPTKIDQSNQIMKENVILSDEKTEIDTTTKDKSPSLVQSDLDKLSPIKADDEILSSVQVDVKTPSSSEEEERKPSLSDIVTTTEYKSLSPVQSELDEPTSPIKLQDKDRSLVQGDAKIPSPTKIDQSNQSMKESVILSDEKIEIDTTTKNKSPSLVQSDLDKLSPIKADDEILSSVQVDAKTPSPSEKEERKPSLSDIVTTTDDKSLSPVHSKLDEPTSPIKLQDKDRSLVQGNAKIPSPPKIDESNQSMKESVIFTDEKTEIDTTTKDKSPGLVQSDLDKLSPIKADDEILSSVQGDAKTPSPSKVEEKKPSLSKIVTATDDKSLSPVHSKVDEPTSPIKLQDKDRSLVQGNAKIPSPPKIDESNQSMKESVIFTDEKTEIDTTTKDKSPGLVQSELDKLFPIKAEDDNLSSVQVDAKTPSPSEEEETKPSLSEIVTTTEYKLLSPVQSELDELTSPIKLQDKDHSLVQGDAKIPTPTKIDQSNQSIKESVVLSDEKTEIDTTTKDKSPGLVQSELDKLSPIKAEDDNLSSVQVDAKTPSPSEEEETKPSLSEIVTTTEYKSLSPVQSELDEPTSPIKLQDKDRSLVQGDAKIPTPTKIDQSYQSIKESVVLSDEKTEIDTTTKDKSPGLVQSELEKLSPIKAEDEILSSVQGDAKTPSPSKVEEKKPILSKIVTATDDKSLSPVHSKLDEPTSPRKLQDKDRSLVQGDAKIPTLTKIDQSNQSIKESVVLSDEQTEIDTTTKDKSPGLVQSELEKLSPIKAEDEILSSVQGDAKTPSPSKVEEKKPSLSKIVTATDDKSLSPVHSKLDEPTSPIKLQDKDRSLVQGDAKIPSPTKIDESNQSMKESVIFTDEKTEIDTTTKDKSPGLVQSELDKLSPIKAEDENLSSVQVDAKTPCFSEEEETKPSLSEIVTTTDDKSLSPVQSELDEPTATIKLQDKDLSLVQGNAKITSPTKIDESYQSIKESEIVSDKKTEIATTTDDKTLSPVQGKLDYSPCLIKLQDEKLSLVQVDAETPSPIKVDERKPSIKEKGILSDENSEIVTTTTDNSPGPVQSELDKMCPIKDKDENQSSSQRDAQTPSPSKEEEKKPSPSEIVTTTDDKSLSPVHSELDESTFPIKLQDKDSSLVQGDAKTPSPTKIDKSNQSIKESVILSGEKIEIDTTTKDKSPGLIQKELDKLFPIKAKDENLSSVQGDAKTPSPSKVEEKKPSLSKIVTATDDKSLSPGHSKLDEPTSPIKLQDKDSSVQSELDEPTSPIKLQDKDRSLVQGDAITPMPTKIDQSNQSMKESVILSDMKTEIVTTTKDKSPGPVQRELNKMYSVKVDDVNLSSVQGDAKTSSPSKVEEEKPSPLAIVSTADDKSLSLVQIELDELCPTKLQDENLGLVQVDAKTPSPTKVDERKSSTKNSVISSDEKSEIVTTTTDKSTGSVQSELEKLRPIKTEDENLSSIQGDVKTPSPSKVEEMTPIPSEIVTTTTEKSPGPIQSKLDKLCLIKAEDENLSPSQGDAKTPSPSKVEEKKPSPLEIVTTTDYKSLSPLQSELDEPNSPIKLQGKDRSLVQVDAEIQSPTKTDESNQSMKECVILSDETTEIVTTLNDKSPGMVQSELDKLCPIKFDDENLSSVQGDAKTPSLSKVEEKKPSLTEIVSTGDDKSLGPVQSELDNLCPIHLEVENISSVQVDAKTLSPIKVDERKPSIKESVILSDKKSEIVTTTTDKSPGPVQSELDKLCPIKAEDENLRSVQGDVKTPSSSKVEEMKPSPSEFVTSTDDKSLSLVQSELDEPTSSIKLQDKDRCLVQGDAKILSPSKIDEKETNVKESVILSDEKTEIVTTTDDIMLSPVQSELDKLCPIKFEDENLSSVQGDAKTSSPLKDEEKKSSPAENVSSADDNSLSPVQSELDEPTSLIKLQDKDRSLVQGDAKTPSSTEVDKRKPSIKESVILFNENSEIVTDTNDKSPGMVQSELDKLCPVKVDNENLSSVQGDVETPTKSQDDFNLVQVVAKAPTLTKVDERKLSIKDSVILSDEIQVQEESDRQSPLALHDIKLTSIQESVKTLSPSKRDEMKPRIKDTLSDENSQGPVQKELDKQYPTKIKNEDLSSDLADDKSPSPVQTLSPIEVDERKPSLADAVISTDKSPTSVQKELEEHSSHDDIPQSQTKEDEREPIIEETVILFDDISLSLVQPKSEPRVKVISENLSSVQEDARTPSPTKAGQKKPSIAETAISSDDKYDLPSLIQLKSEYDIIKARDEKLCLNQPPSVTKLNENGSNIQETYDDKSSNDVQLQSEQYSPTKVKHETVGSIQAPSLTKRDQNGSNIQETSDDKSSVDVQLQSEQHSPTKMKDETVTPIEVNAKRDENIFILKEDVVLSNDLPLSSLETDIEEQSPTAAKDQLSSSPIQPKEGQQISIQNIESTSIRNTSKENVATSKCDEKDVDENEHVDNNSTPNISTSFDESEKELKDFIDQRPSKSENIAEHEDKTIDGKDVYEEGESTSEDSQLDNKIPLKKSEPEDNVYTQYFQKDPLTHQETTEVSVVEQLQKTTKSTQDISDKLSSISTVDSGIADRDSILYTLGHGSSSEDVSKEVSLEEKYSFESPEKNDKKILSKKLPLDETVTYTTISSMSSNRKDEVLSAETPILPNVTTEITKAFESVQKSALSSQEGSPKKEDNPVSETSDSGIHSIPTDINQTTININKETSCQTIKDSATHLMDSIHKAFEEEAIQQGIKSEEVDYLVHSEYERVSTPPTVPVSPLPKTPNSFQDIKVTEGVQSEVSYDKPDGAEESVTKVVHVGEDVLTQKISTSTEKVPKTLKSSDVEGNTELTAIMQTVGKIKTETDTVTKIIKEGENVVTQTITTVTTKEVISREDGTPQNVKTTIETTTLSKGSDGTITTTTDTQTLLSECSSSLRSTSEMDTYCKDSKVDTISNKISDDKIDIVSSSQDFKRNQNIENELSVVDQDENVTVSQLKPAFVTETDEDDDTIEDTVIDTDVSKRVIKENNIDILETITTVTKKETLKIDKSKKVIRTTTETNKTKEYPDGSKDVQKNVEVKTEEIVTDSSNNLDKILNEFTLSGQPDVSVTTETVELEQDNVIIKRTISTKIIITKYADNLGYIKKVKKDTIVTTTDNYPDGSSRTKVDSSTSLSDTYPDDFLESFELTDLNVVENINVEVEEQEKPAIVNGKSVVQLVTTTTTKETLTNKDKSKKKIKTTIETVTKTMLPDGMTEITKDTKVTIADAEAEIAEEEEFQKAGNPKEETTTNIEFIKDNEKEIKRKTTITKTIQEFHNLLQNIKRTKTTIKTVIEDENPDKSVSTRISEKVGIVDENLTTSQNTDKEFMHRDKTVQESLIGYNPFGEPRENSSTESEVILENGITVKRKTTVTTIEQEYFNEIEKSKRVKTTVKTLIEDLHPDGTIITKISEHVSVTDENTDNNTNKERIHKQILQNTDDNFDFNISTETLLDKLIPKNKSKVSETTKFEELIVNDIKIKRKTITKIVKTIYSDHAGPKKLKTVTIVTTTDEYPDGSLQTTVNTNTSISDVEIEETKTKPDLTGYSKIEDKSVSVDTQEKTLLIDGQRVIQVTTTTTTKEILSSDDGAKKKLKTTVEMVTETKLPNGVTEITKDIKVSVADYGVDCVDDSLQGYTKIGDEDTHTTTDTTTFIENNVKIIRKTSITTVRQEYENEKTKTRKIKTNVQTVVEDELPDGTVITKKSEKVSISDVFLQTPELPMKHQEEDTTEICSDDTEIVEDTVEESDVVNETFEKDSIKIKRTVTTKTKKETLASSNKHIKRVRTTIETTTVDEFPDGYTETTKDVKITMSEFQKTTDNNLQAALQELEPSGKTKRSVDKKVQNITENGENITQTVTTFVTKEELKNSKSNEIAVKTITETVTEKAKSDGSTEITKDIRTQITYLPVGTELEDWTPEELEEIEKQPTTEEKSKLEELPLKLNEVMQPEVKSKKQRSPVGEITTETETFTKVVKEGDHEVNQTITVVTTKEIISPEKVKVTVETTTVSKGSDGITKTSKSTKTTISEFKEEYEEIIDTGESEKSSKYSSSRTGDMRSSSAASDEMDHPGISSPPSEISSRGSKAAVHVWGTESSGIYYSDDDGQVSPSSTKSQVAHSPKSNLSFEIDKREESHDIPYEKPDKCSSMLEKDPMSMSIYGQLPEEESCTSSTHSEVKSEIHITDKSISMVTEEFLSQEISQSQQKSTSDATFLKEADEHFEKAIEEHKKVSGSDVISNITAKYELDQDTNSSHKLSTEKQNAITLKDIKSENKKTVEVTSSSSTSKPSTKTEKSEEKLTKDPIESWGKPLGLPSPTMPPTQDGKSTPKKTTPSSNILNKNKINQEKSKEAKSRVSESPSKKKVPAPVYLELTYVPHHGNSYYSALEFFKRVRARYYVFSGTEPSKEIYNALLDAKKTWEDKDLEVTIIPTYDTDVLGYWVTENEDALEKYKIDLSPSASRCTINLQDHETSCAAYRLEF